MKKPAQRKTMQVRKLPSAMFQIEAPMMAIGAV
jgi:hypothetical protein